MIDVSTKYLGLKLNGPIVVSSTPLSESIENVRRMEDAGASAIVLTSLFEEQLALESRALDEDLSRGTESFAESLGYLPDLNDYRMTHEVYLEHIRRCKDAVNIPILASLNGATTGGWVRFAQESEEAGADAIELNTYALATDRSQTSYELEAQLLELVESVCKAVKVPVAVKLSQSFTSLPHMAAKLEDAGAAGVVLFNRFYQPDFDIEGSGGAAHAALLHAVGVAAPPPLGRDSLWPPQHRYRHHRRRALGRRCHQEHHGRRQRRHDVLGAPYPRHRTHRPRSL